MGTAVIKNLTKDTGNTRGTGAPGSKTGTWKVIGIGALQGHRTAKGTEGSTGQGDRNGTVSRVGSVVETRTLRGGDVSCLQKDMQMCITMLHPHSPGIPSSGLAMPTDVQRKTGKLLSFLRSGPLQDACCLVQHWCNPADGQVAKGM